MIADYYDKNSYKIRCRMSSKGKTFFFGEKNGCSIQPILVVGGVIKSKI